MTLSRGHMLEAGPKPEPRIPFPKLALCLRAIPQTAAPAAPTQLPARKLPSSFSPGSPTAPFPTTLVGTTEPPPGRGKGPPAATLPRLRTRASALHGPPTADSPVPPDAALPGSRSVRKRHPIRSEGASKVLPPRAEARHKRSDCFKRRLPEPGDLRLRLPGS